MLQIRQAAMEAFLKHTAKAALQRAEHGRSRVMKEFKLGELVYVYRVPLRRRGERENNKPKWVGPGSIIMIEGANVWISMRGELWKCAKEQVRRATSEEEQASEMLKEEYAELKEQLARGSSKRSFQDISGWGIPPEEDDPPILPRPPTRRRTQEAEGEAPGGEVHEERMEEGTAEATGTTDGSDSTEDSSTTEEPEREVVQEQEPLTDAVIDAAVASRHHNENLDGTLRGRGREDLYGPTRRRLERMWGPYRGGVAPVDEEEEQERGGEADEDYWIYDEDRSSIVRVHQVARRVRFTPSSTRGCPVPLAALTSGRRTYREYGDGSTSTDRGRWRAEVGKKEVQTRWWVGFTEFKLRKKVAGLHLMVKRGSDEVLEKDIKGEEEWEKWRVADGAEWSKVEATGAVRTMSIEESREVEQQLSEAGLQRRILPSRIVRRWKPGDQPGTPPSRKSRWCIRGDKDPDLLDLVRHAPTVTTSTLAIALQICACQGWDAAVGDLRNAFMQSERLVRPSGRLYCQQPKGGLPGLHSEQLIEILAGAYGLGDAPAHWRKTLKKAIFDIGMSQSVLDPTVYKWYDGGVLEGLVVVEVDDLLIMGTSKFFQRFEGLKQRFEFGKFVKVKEQEEGTSFNGRRIRHVNGDFMIDMEKFVKERLEPVSLDRGRKAEDPATPEEKERTRAVVGSLTWAAKEGRPDAAAAASLVASSLANLKVQDIMDLNRAVKIVKQRPDLHLKIQAIDPNRLGWGVVTDASFANASKGRSQGAHAVIAYDQRLLDHGRGKCNLLHWRSGKIQRVANSTLAAETQSMSRGLGELSWTVTVYNELMKEGFNLKKWEEELQRRQLQAFASESSEPALIQGVCVVDAKSLFDHLSKETVGTTSDKRTALEMQVIRQTLAETGTKVRWVPHPRMIVDALTKKQGNVQPLINLLDSGILELTDSNKNLGAV